ncbi:MAG: CerR family C-terminal domain-containing protein [Deltaproteobacteria bacterium]|nr:CerR family C-terminal domain-containing protein [Deltaproteobacteria bacterium]NIS77502.1 CerR family C-terminal domain-containing protein [Deltaproteobacteria bacterium]
MTTRKKRNRSPEEVRQKILVAAEELFAEKGFAATSIREIAARADVNSAMIYYYFDDKQGLYRSIIDLCSNETYRMLLRAFKGKRDPSEQLREFCIEYARAHYLNRDIVKIMHREMFADDGHLSDFVSLYFRKSLDTVRDILERGIDTGRFREVDIELTAATLFGLILFIFLTEPVVASLRKQEALDEAAVVGITGELIDIFLAGIVKQHHQAK